MGIGGVADYDTRIVIWENAAGNSSRSKLDDMNINYNGNKVLSTILFGTKIVNTDYKDVERTIPVLRIIKNQIPFLGSNPCAPKLIFVEKRASK